MSISNSQIAIAGRVLEGESEKIIAGAVVEIIEMPEKFKSILSLKTLQYGLQWEKMRDRIDRKITTNDGYFHFVNLPKGEYVIEASLPNSGTRYSQVKKTVQVADSVDGKIPTHITDIVLLPTGIKGKITDADDPKKAVVNAKIKIKDSRDSTFSDQRGHYSLLGLESSKSGQRNVTLIVSATGYQQVSQSVLIKQGEVISEQNFSLKQT